MAAAPPLYAQLHGRGSGLSNQLISLINGIRICKDQKRQLLLIDTIRNQFDRDAVTPISEVLDLENTNEWLHKQFGVTIVDVTKNREIAEGIAPFNTWIKFPLRDFGICGHVAPNLVFHQQFREKAATILADVPKDCKINCIHLRLEHDGIQFWAGKNKLSWPDFTKKLSDHYIQLLQEHCKKEDHLIVLSYSTDNAVIQWLRENGWSFSLTPKDLAWGREMNALVDLLVADACNNVFISSFHTGFFTGSSFSYMITRRLPKTVKIVNINMDNLGR